MSFVKIISSMLMLLLLCCQSKSKKEENIAPEGWIALFDGKSLDSWEANENPNTFTVKDGMIVAEGPRSHLYYKGAVKQADFKNFEFRADYKTEAKANSGIYFHTKFDFSTSPQKGYETQIYNTYGDGPSTGSLYNVVNFTDSPIADNEWFTVHITVVDKRIVVKLNDQLRLDYDEDTDENATDRKQPKLSSGPFALQHWNPKSRSYIKNIFVKPLP
jgi:hypothetical protein